MRSTLCLTLGFAATVSAVNLDGTQAMLKTHHEWMLGSPAPPTTPLSLVFCVNENLPGLSDAVNALADPKSPTYGRWLTLDQVNAKWSDTNARGAVRTFLEAQEVAFESVGDGSFFKVDLTVQQADQMLGARFTAYTKGSDTIYRSSLITVPASVAPFVDRVEYATKMPATQTGMFSVLKSGASDDSNPKVIADYYGITKLQVDNANCTNSVFETIGQGINTNDVIEFDNKYNIAPQSFTIIGPNKPALCAEDPNNCIESTLDTQIITALAQQPKGKSITTWWSVPGTESFLQWIMAVSADKNAPWVHSISYGENEKYTYHTQDDSFDQALQKIALRGVTVVVSSGDDGVAGPDARNLKSQCGFNPSYPATAIHVTSVGATMGPEDQKPETACTSERGGGITTGGGFSVIYKQPDFQKKQVQKYLATARNLPPSSMFEGSMRGYPDVGTMGHNYPIVISGQTYHASGTSASAPLFAAMVTLANDARISNGKGPLGWLNPALYSLDLATWNNITVGENNCAAGPDQYGHLTCCDYGFSETEGWSPITGLGSPRFQRMLSALKAL